MESAGRGGRFPPESLAANSLSGLFAVRALGAATWPDFARLVERHNGVWGGCWCMGFHAEGVGRAVSTRVAKISSISRIPWGVMPIVC